MIIIDMNQISLASLMMHLNMTKTKEPDENMVRHMILNSIRMYRSQFHNEYGEVVLAYDSKHYWRRDYFPNYKAGRRKGREKSDLDWDVIFEVLNKIKSEIKENLPYKFLEIYGAEADDIIAYASKQVLTDSKVTIMSSDKDFLQLVDDRISVWSPTKKKLYKPEQVMEEYGIPSHNLLMYRIFDGDKSDNIDGVRGYGLKTVIKKLPFLQEEKQFSVDDAIKESSELEEHRETMERNFDLMQLHNVNISASAKTKTIDKVREPIPKLQKETFKKMFIEDKMYSALPNLETWLQTKFQTLVKFIGQ